MAENENKSYFDTLQVSPTAEPEVIAAAYRALAKKYHPDRSAASDAPTRMARINVAFQALRTRIGRITETEANTHDQAPDLSYKFAAELPDDHVDPNASLEEILSFISHRMSAVRQYVIDEVTRDGVARDLATNLVNTAIREQCGDSAEKRGTHTRPRSVPINSDTSYEDALRIVMQKAEGVRDELAEDLIRNGLNRGAATELADQAFERIRRRSATSAGAAVRLTNDHVDPSASLDDGVRVVTEKLKAARQMVVDELTRDGLPLRTAEQLLEAATVRPDKTRRR